ncbi:MauE/DoxX family redox-associated membrane protein [Niastella sp. OAS944]|uniref:MauE/DoxX family redox-associated membrane protein n=1 Tax=Niastella sp. OAS944 TaxID=2664089 RepID=UPI00347A12AF|nr:hypothetical protein [Chitinophagaceae bacterium OAS944]
MENALSLTYNKRLIAVDFICLILMANFIYEGLIKILAFQQYGIWLYYAPFLTSASSYLKYIIPIFEITLGVMLVIRQFKQFALYLSIISQLIFLAYTVSWIVFSSRIYWTFHGIWSFNRVPWFEKMIYTLAISWLCLVCLIIMRKDKPNIVRRKLSDIT